MEQIVLVFRSNDGYRKIGGNAVERDPFVLERDPFAVAELLDTPYQHERSAGNRYEFVDQCGENASCEECYEDPFEQP